MADASVETDPASAPEHVPPEPAQTEVIIVGAGPTGLMAAAVLVRCGVKFRILNKSETAAHESRAFGVQAKSLELFLNMGLIEHVMDY